MTTFAAAEIARADPMKTGFSSLKIGSHFYIIPILFIFTNILSGNIFQVILVGLISICGLYFFCSGMEGYLLGELSGIKRILSYSIFIMIFASIFNIFPLGLKIVLLLLSLILAVSMFLSQKKSKQISQRAVP